LFSFIDTDHGRPLNHIAPRFEYEGLEQDVADVLRSGAPKELQLELRDGRWFLMRILPYRSAENRVEGAVLTFADITAVKTAELEVQRLRGELEAQVRWLNALVDVVPVGIAFHEAGRPELRLNRAAAELLELDAAPVSARGADSLPFEWRPGEATPTPAASLWSAMTASERVQGFEVELGAEGARRSMVVHAAPLQGERGEVYAQVSALLDVTATKRAMKQALERERQQALIAEIGLRALETSEFSDFLASTLELVASAVGTDLADVCQLESEAGGMRAIGAAGFRSDWRAAAPELAPPEVVAAWTLEHRNSLPLSEPLAERLATESIVAGTRVPIWISHGELFGVLGVYSRTPRTFSHEDRVFLRGVAHVITTAIQRTTLDRALSRAREAAALARSQEQLRRAERLASLGTFAAGIAHEVNNPLTNIALAAEYAQKTEDASKRTSLLGNVIKNAQRCGRIVESVLSFARDETSQKWPNQINDVLRQSAELLRASVDSRRLEVVFELAEPSPRVECNPTELEQVFVNLMKNAVEASSEKCRICLRSERVGDKVRLSIADDGPGIAAEDRARIFDPFFSTRRNAGGTGLGLSITHRIMSSHGGTISVANDVQRGTRFDLELPALDSALKE
jgi:signal transduction histidine kinase/PAS domain-containing protein